MTICARNTPKDMHASIAMLHNGMPQGSKLLCICMSDEEISRVRRMECPENEHPRSAIMEPMFPCMHVRCNRALLKLDILRAD
jgi:hypothetical protein